VTTLGSVVVHQLWLDQDSLVLDLSSNGTQELTEGVLLLCTEFSGRL
jgi:hypothetical protein